MAKRHRQAGNNSSRFKGVSSVKQGCNWRVRLGGAFIGRFDDEVAAAKAWDAAALKIGRRDLTLPLVSQLY
jgi:hypothetical protein